MRLVVLAASAGVSGSVFVSVRPEVAIAVAVAVAVAVANTLPDSWLLDAGPAAIEVAACLVIVVSTLATFVYLWVVAVAAAALVRVED